MRRRSVTGPLMLLLVGGLFLWRNLHPETPVFEMLGRYWPFLLILWGLLRLVEVAFTSNDQQRRGGFSGGEIVLIVFICIAGMGMWEARNLPIRFSTGGLEWFGEQFDYPVSANAAAAGMKRVVFENPRGNVRVIGGDVQQITITGHKTIRAYSHVDADRTNTNTPLEILPQGDRLLVRTNEDRAPDSQRMSEDIEVTVPRGVAVESRGTAGDYEISDVQGDVELTTSRGDIRLARVGGNARLDIGHSSTINVADLRGKIDLQGRGEDIDLENIGGEVIIKGSFTRAEFKNLAKPVQFEGARNTELRVAAIPGHLNMDLSTLSATGITGPTRFVTRSRDIKIDDFTQSMLLETERGDIELAPHRTPLSQIEVRSGNGAVELALPERGSFQLQATAERGDAVNDYGTAIERNTEGRMATLRGKTGDGPTITLTANRGTITVRKDTGDGAPEKAGKDSPAKNLKDTEVKM